MKKRLREFQTEKKEHMLWSCFSCPSERQWVCKMLMEKVCTDKHGLASWWFGKMEGDAKRVFQVCHFQVYSWMTVSFICQKLRIMKGEHHFGRKITSWVWLASGRESWIAVGCRSLALETWILQVWTRADRADISPWMMPKPWLWSGSTRELWEWATKRTEPWAPKNLGANLRTGKLIVDTAKGDHKKAVEEVWGGLVHRQTL